MGRSKLQDPKDQSWCFHPWSVKDLKEAVTHLPHPKVSRDKFAAELLVFCQEFRPTMQDVKCLLMLKLGAKDWQKVRLHFQVNNAAIAAMWNGLTMTTDHIKMQWNFCGSLKLHFQ